MSEMRIGQGYDIHAFEQASSAGNHIMLGGVPIPHDRRIIAHSDGDVVLHALADALLGAIGAGDIGVHFPPSDARFKDTASHIFLNHALKLCKSAGFLVGNADITLVAQEPKIGQYREEIIGNLARLLELDAARLSIKATTNEGLGSLGRGEGIAALAIVLLRQSG